MSDNTNQYVLNRWPSDNAEERERLYNTIPDLEGWHCMMARAVYEAEREYLNGVVQVTDEEWAGQAAERIGKMQVQALIKRKIERDHHHRRARYYLFGTRPKKDEQDNPFTFENVCEELGWNPEYLRRKIKERAADREQSLKGRGTNPLLTTCDACGAVMLKGNQRNVCFSCQPNKNRKSRAKRRVEA